MRFIKQGHIRNPTTGVVISGATVTVYLAGTSTLATIYSASSGGSAISGSQVTTDSNGYYIFYVDNTVYNSYQLFDLTIAGSGLDTKTFPNIDIIDNSHGNGDVRNHGAVGDGSTSDQTALDLAFADSTVHFPEGTFMGYELSLSAVSKLSGLGQGSIIKCNNLAADFVVGFQDYPTPTGRTKLTITDLVIDGNKALGTYTGSGHGIDIRGYDEVYIDRLEVKNATSHGVVIADCAKVRIGTLVVHDNGGYGITFDSNLTLGLAEEITIDTIIAYSNGTAGSKYPGIEFADLSATTTGSRKVSIGKVYTFSNGLSGLAFGRNATAGATGPSDITVGEIHTYSNSNLGVEFFGCSNVVVGSIHAYSNVFAGVGIYRGDNNSPTFDYALAENISIGQIISHNNGYDGVDIMGAFKLNIGSIQAYNNSIGNTNTYSGVRLRANNPGANVNYNKDIHISSILAYDDQGTPTQKYGFARENAVHGGYVSIGNIRAYGNATSDIADVVTDGNFVDALSINSWDVTSISPTYGDNVNGAGVRYPPFKLRGMYYGVGQTNDATTNSLMKVPIPENKVCTVEAIIGGTQDSTYVERGSYKVTVMAFNDGTNTNVVGTATTVHEVETDAGLAGTVVSGGVGDFIVIGMTGLAATTINWKAAVRVVEH